MILRWAVVIPVLALSLAACGTTTGGRGVALSASPAPSVSSVLPPPSDPLDPTDSADPSTPSTPTSTPSPTATALPALPTNWHRMTDAASGVSFALPLVPKLTSSSGAVSDGTPIVKHTYVSQVTEDYGISVTTEAGTPGRPVEFSKDLTQLATTLQAQFRKVGVIDAKVSEREKVMVGRYRAYDFLFRFTPLKPGSGRSIWFVREIRLDNALVIVQTIDFPPASDDETPVARVRADHGRVLAALRLP